MDQEFKPTEDIKPTEETSTSQPIEVSHPAAMQPAEAMPSSEVEHPAEVAKLAATMPKFKSAKKSHGKTILVIILILLLAAAGAVAYWWRDKTANDSAATQTASITTLNARVVTLQAQLAAANSAAPTSNTGCTPIAPIATTIESIKASITSGNTAALEGYMADSVNVVLAASEGIGTTTPTQAVSSITNFITSATAPWNFALAPAVLTQFKAGDYSQYFPTIAVVGMSANNKVISFGFDCNGKISTVFLAPTKDLLL